MISSSGEGRDYRRSFVRLEQVPVPVAAACAVAVPGDRCPCRLLHEGVSSLGLAPESPLLEGAHGGQGGESRPGLEQSP